ncbi:DNA translocase FtsK [Campylobacter sp. MG1]|uniref:DNA translocase FtsK n=1 Tax=Campylobacter sp. MG1 TaxID=2976332 RepID=UPI00226D2BD3|nr:DNA translocase FtsK [Campylobacter sp. MG1]
MKKEIIFIFSSFLIFYFSIGLFLKESTGFLLLSFYFAKFLKYMIGDLSYLFLLLFLANFLYLKNDFRYVYKFSINMFLVCFLFGILLSSIIDLGILNLLGILKLFFIVLILCVLLYLNFSYICNIKNIKFNNKNTILNNEKNIKFNKKIDIKDDVVYETKKTINIDNDKEILKDLGDIQFVRVNNINDVETIEKELEPLFLEKETINYNVENTNQDEDIINLNAEIDNNEESVIIEELEHQSFVPKAGKKIEILSELEENKAILSELELGTVEIPKDFELPNVELLDIPENKEIIIDEDELDEKINELLAKLKHFKIDGDVVKTYWGPVVTTFEFKPAADVKLSKISSLSDDLAMALKATSIRIQAPIPGKDVVGIEIPNKTSQTINIRTMFEDNLFIKSKSKLTIALGKDIVGNTFITDLKKLPHLLIAGTTGSGKSVGINAMILSLLYKNTPRTLRLLMIDPKMLEFSMYNEIPHLLTPVITRPEKATIALKNMVLEMERRYELMSNVHTKNIDNFNEKAPKLGLEPLAYIVIIIDELADLMMTGGKEVEVYIARLAQMARAAGIHLIVATQRPSVDVITGLIKANLPSRLSYKVSTQTDSKVILDTKGAESLLGRGDSLFTPPGVSSIVRLHAPFASEDEIIKVVEHLKSQEKVSYDESILQDSSITNTYVVDNNDALDEKFEEAVRIMRESNKTSISYIQRQLNIGYNRAANIIEQCEKQGILSEPNTKGVRTLL